MPCAAVTAWNALYHGAKPLRVGDTVVTQGTGGVSVFAALFAVRAGARVNGTTSSTGKAEKLKKMGVQHVINYKENPEWGMVVQQLTAGRGAQYVVEVGGPGTLKQSGISAGLNGEIGIVGALGGVGETVGLHEIMCATRRVFVGDRVMFEEMNRAMEVAGIRPVVDGKVFGFEKMREAYWYFEKQGFFGKVVVRVG